MEIFPLRSLLTKAKQAKVYSDQMGKKEKKSLNFEIVLLDACKSKLEKEVQKLCKCTGVHEQGRTV